jgi:hypothetical protein
MSTIQTVNTQSETTTKRNLNSKLDAITDDRIHNRDIVIDSFIVEIDKLKSHLIESKSTIKNTNTLNLGDEAHLPNAINITNSFNMVTMLMGIYRMSDFSKEGIENTKKILLTLQGQISSEIGNELSKELTAANLGGGGRKRGSKKSRKYAKE